MRIHTAALAALMPAIAAGDSVVNLDAGYGDTQYTVQHWETGAQYDYTVPAGQSRSVSVPHDDGTLLLYEEGWRVDTFSAGRDGEATQWARQSSVPDVEPVRDTAQANQVRIKSVSTTADRNAAGVSRNAYGIDRNRAGIEHNRESINLNSARISRNAHGIAAVAAMSQHGPAPRGVSLSVAGAEYGGRQAGSVALQWRGERFSARASWAESGGESVTGGSVAVRLW